MSDMELAQISLDPGFIVVSSLVSFIGTLFGLELLQRRTSIHGSLNWCLLVGAATSLGAVGMWSMHFLSNRAVKMLEKTQVSYSVSGTIGSFLAPIAFMGLSLYPMSRSCPIKCSYHMSGLEFWSVVEIVFSGLMASGGALAMFFISEANMTNYTRTSTSASSLCAAVIILLLADCVAFWMFFGFKANETSSFPKMSASALLLAGAASAMQWLLKLGADYRFTGTKHSSSWILSRKAELLAPLVLGVCCLLGLFVLPHMRLVANQKAAKRIPHMLLACAFFDDQQRLMVTPEGWVPCKKITDTRLERGFHNLFDVDHPIFCWLFRASFCWKSIEDSFPRILSHIETMKKSQQESPERQDLSTLPASSAAEENLHDWGLLFRLLFLVAANDLASMIQQPVEKIGNLFPGVLDIGTIRKPRRRRWSFKGTSIRDHDNHNHVDPEAGRNRTFGRGQAMFLVRTVSSEESEELEAAGYRFILPERILRSFSKNMEITQEQAEIFIGEMQLYSAGERAYAVGVHVACFMIRPEFSRGFGILVHKKAKNILPAAQLPISRLEPWQLEFLLRMEDFTLDQCCKQLEIDYKVGPSMRERIFASWLFQAMTQLRDQIDKSRTDEDPIDHPISTTARLWAYPLEAPSGIPSQTSQLKPATLIAFRTMLDINQNSYDTDKYVFVPWRFFACLQRVYKGHPHHGAFVYHMRRQCVALHRDDVPEARETGLQKARRSFQRFSRTAFDRMRLDVLWATNKLNMPSPSSTFILSPWRRSNTTDGKRSVNRNVQASAHTSNETAAEPIMMDILEMLETRPSVEAPTASDIASLDKPTYADELMRVVVEDRIQTTKVVNRIDPAF